MGEIIMRKVKGMNWKTKISLLLVFTLVFSVFMHQGWYKPKVTEAAATANGRIFYGNLTATPQNRVYTASSNTFAAGAATLAGVIPTHVVMKAAPTRNERMAGYVTGTGVLYILKWDGATWIEVTNTAAPSGWGVGTRPTVGGNGVNGRRFDIAYENTSGNAMVVYSTNATGTAGYEMAYRIWNGSSWTAAATINSAQLNQNASVTSIKLASRPNSNEIALTAQDNGLAATANTSKLTSFIWDGVSAWGYEPAAAHTSNMYSVVTTQLVQNDHFDMAYETSSGELLVVFITSATPAAGETQRTYSAGTWGTSTNFNTRVAVNQIVAASDPDSDKIIVAYNRPTTTNTYVNIWDGAAMGATTTAGACAAPAVSQRTLDVGWLSGSGVNVAVVVWKNATAGQIAYSSNPNGTGAWTAATYTPTNAVAYAWMDIDVDPFSKDTLMLTASDTGADLWAKRLVLTAGPTLTWTQADGGTALTATLTNATTQNFSFAYDRYAPNMTNTGTATAAAASATSILVTMPYTQDANTNNTYTVDYKLTSSGTWTNWVTAAGHVASPYTTTITGLTEGSSYDVRCTWNDADGVIGTNAQVITPVVTPVNSTAAGTATATAASATSIAVSMPYTNDGNANNTYTVDYKLSSSGTWTNWVTAATHVASPYTTTITGLTTDNKYDVRATYNDANGVTGTNPQTISTIWVGDSLIHNYGTTGSSYWSGNSGWGVSGTKYGKFICATCHSSSTTNIKRVKTSIATPDATNWASNSAASVATTFTNFTVSAGAMGDPAAHATSTRVCEVCHSQVSLHKYNQGAVTHMGIVDCTTCHKHNKGFTGDGPCLGCHNAAITSLYNPRNVSTDFTRLSRHVSNGTATSIVTNYDCVVCHAEGDASKVAAGTGWLDKTKHKNGTTSNGTPATDRKVKLRNVDNYTQTYDWNKKLTTGTYVAGDRTTMRNNMDTFCMNCHDSNGASAIAVNNTTDGLLLNDTSTTRTSTTKTVNLRPFNVSDNLQNGFDNSGTYTLATFRTTTYGRVLDVKSQFNSGNAVGSNWASHHNLNQFTKRYTANNTTTWPAAAWTAYVTKEGVNLNTGASTTAGLHCSDCHLNETNAHGSTNAWYMLQSKSGNITPGSEPDTPPTTTGLAATANENICFRCHATGTYATDGTGFANSRNDHTNDCAGSRVDYSRFEYRFGNQCYACHGGYGDTAQVASGGLGSIHGTNETYTPGYEASAGANSKRYRFMSGATMRFYNPRVRGTNYAATTDWQISAETGACYTTGSNDTWNGTCTSHTVGGGDDTVSHGKARLIDY